MLTTLSSNTHVVSYRNLMGALNTS